MTLAALGFATGETRSGRLAGCPSAELIVIWTKWAAKLHGAKERRLVVAEFLATFIMPLLAFDFTRWEDLLLFAIFFGALGYLCLHHNYLFVNIVIDLLGYRVYECELHDSNGGEREWLVLSRLPLSVRVGESIDARGITNSFLLDCTDGGTAESG